MGDQVEVTGTVNEVFSLRQIQSAVPTIQSSGNTLPTEVLAPGAINDEQWECVLVEMTGTVSGITPNFGEWTLSDGVGQGMAASLGYNAVNDSILVDTVNVALVEVGLNYRVTGPNFYSFGNWKVCPRDAADVVRIGCTDATFPNYDPLASEDDGSCSNVSGCTDESADNYNPDATADDGSCVIKVHRPRRVELQCQHHVGGQQHDVTTRCPTLSSTKSTTTLATAKATTSTTNLLNC